MSLGDLPGETGRSSSHCLLLSRTLLWQHLCSIGQTQGSIAKPHLSLNRGYPKSQQLLLKSCTLNTQMGNLCPFCRSSSRILVLSTFCLAQGLARQLQWHLAVPRPWPVPGGQSHLSHLFPGGAGPRWDVCSGSTEHHHHRHHRIPSPGGETAAALLELPSGQRAYLGVRPQIILCYSTWDIQFMLWNPF